MSWVLMVHSTQSNGGNYSCSVSIEDMVVSSGEVAVNVESRKDLNAEPRKDLKTIISATVESIIIAGLIMVLVIVLLYVRRKRYWNQTDLEHEPLMREGVVDKDDHAGIRDNIILGEGHHWVPWLFFFQHDNDFYILYYYSKPGSRTGQSSKFW